MGGGVQSLQHTPVTGRTEAVLRRAASRPVQATGGPLRRVVVHQLRVDGHLLADLETVEVPILPAHDGLQHHVQLGQGEPPGDAEEPPNGELGGLGLDAERVGGRGRSVVSSFLSSAAGAAGVTHADEHRHVYRCSSLLAPVVGPDLPRVDGLAAPRTNARGAPTADALHIAFPVPRFSVPLAASPAPREPRAGRLLVSVASAEPVPEAERAPGRLARRQLRIRLDHRARRPGGLSDDDDRHRSHRGRRLP